LVVGFFLAALAGGAVVLVTRPDLVLMMTLGCSTTAGAWHSQSLIHDGGKNRASEGEHTRVVLRMLPELALGLTTAFLGPVFFTAGLMVVFAVVFLVAAFLAARALVVFYSGCQISANEHH
jgi:hypothetical protein